MEDSTILVIVAMICLVIIELAALMHNVNGALLGVVISIISGLAGYEIKALRVSRQ